jgi:hypothetical protein
MSQKALQAVGGVFNSESLTNLESNLDELYAYYGIAGGNPFATNRFVDGDNGSDTNNGLTRSTAFQTIQGAINASGQGDRIFIKALEAESASGDTDPDSYAETLTITGKDGLQLIGVGRGLAQGGQPQIRIGAGSTALLTVNSFGVGIHNLTFNGVSSTGGGIKLVANGSTADAGGTVISGCHFKNCQVTTAATGGAIYWSSAGGCWYVTIVGCEFFDCRAGIVVIGTTGSAPKAVKILDCRFWSTANTSIDADLYAGGSGFTGLVMNGCIHGTVDVPAYATSPDAARYIKLLGGSGIISNAKFACTGKTFGATGDGCIIPTTTRMASCHQENAIITRA